MRRRRGRRGLGLSVTVSDPSWTQQDANEWAAWVPSWAGPTIITADDPAFDYPPGSVNAYPVPRGNYIGLALLDPEASGNQVFGAERFYPLPLDWRMVKADVYDYVAEYRAAYGGSGLSPEHRYAGSPWADPAYVPELLLTRIQDAEAGAPINTTLPDPGDFTDTPGEPWGAPPEEEPGPTFESYIIEGIRIDVPLGTGPDEAARMVAEGCVDPAILSCTSTTGPPVNGGGGNGGGGNGSGGPPGSSVPGGIPPAVLLGGAVLAFLLVSRR